MKSVFCLAITILLAGIGCGACACQKETVNITDIISLELLLARAVQKGNFPECQKLLQNGADPKKGGCHALLPLAAAASFTKICELLLLHGADVNACGIGGYTALHFAAETGNFELCQKLLAHGADVNAAIPDDSGSCSNFTPLFFAIQTKNIPLCRLLLNNKANVNHQAVFWNWKKTPLTYAAELNNFELCKLFVSKGSITRDNFEYGTPEIREYVQMAHKLKLVQAEKLKLSTFTEEYLNSFNSKKNVLAVTTLLLELWGIQSPFFTKLWGLYDEQLKNHFFLVSDFELLKAGKMQLDLFDNRHLGQQNLKKNIPTIIDLVLAEKNYSLTEKFMVVFGNKLGNAGGPESGLIVKK